MGRTSHNGIGGRPTLEAAAAGGGSLEAAGEPVADEPADERHLAHHTLVPHWSFTVTLLLLAVAFGWDATNKADYVTEVLVALSAVAASPTLVAFTPGVRHRRRVRPRQRHRYHVHGVRLSFALLGVAAACVALAATVGLASWVTVAVLAVVVVLLVATLANDHAVPVEPGHVEGWSARLSHALHSPAFAGLLVFASMAIGVVLAWSG